jgi:hypothetical protein
MGLKVISESGTQKKENTHLVEDTDMTGGTGGEKVRAWSRGMLSHLPSVMQPEYD